MSVRNDEGAPGDRPDSSLDARALPPTRSVLWTRVGVAAAIGILVLIYLQGVGLNTLYVVGLNGTLNDQVIYVDAARNVLAKGELSTGAIYPSTLLQEYGRNYFYMPGHALLTALSFALFGDRVWSAMLPNIIAFGFCIACLYAAGRRLFGSAVGVYAAVGFALTPIFLVYTFSAMAEMTLLASSLFAFAAFVYVPRRLQHWAAPFLLLFPFLFRETSAFWIAPMVVLLLTSPEATRFGRFRAAAIALIGSILTLGFVYRLDWIADRPSLWMQNLFGRTYEEKYADAFSVEGVDMDSTTIVTAFQELGVSNLGEFVKLLTTPSFESVTVHALLWLPLGAAALAWRTPRFRPLAGASVLFGFVTFGFVTILYRWDFYIGLRQLLPPMTLGLLLLGAALAERVPTWSMRLRATVAVGTWLFLSILVVHQIREVTAFNETVSLARRFLQKTPVSEQGVFVLDHSYGLIYLYDHPLRQFSFPPSNRATLELLDARHDVRAALLMPNQVSLLTDEGIHATGLRAVGTIAGIRFFREPRRANPTDSSRREVRPSGGSAIE